MTATSVQGKQAKHLAHLTALVLILLLAAGLRFHRLGAQSFWNDEGNTARLVERPVALILEGAAGDVHPPGYYLVLRLWRATTGDSEFALRAYSAFCGILTVAVTVAASRCLQGHGQKAMLTTIIAATLVAVHPLAVYYSQEARMYAQLGLVSALTLWASMALLRRHAPTRQGRRLLPLIGLAVSIAAGLYTQYTYVLTLTGLNVAFGLTWLLQLPCRSRWSEPRHGPLLLSWLGAHVIGGLIFVPWAPIALGAGGWRPPDLGATSALAAMARTLLGGVTQPNPPGPAPLVAAGLLAVIALGLSLSRPRASVARFGIWAATGMALAPPLLIAVTGIYRPAYLKFLISCIAPLAVVLASPLLATSMATKARRRHASQPWRQMAGVLAIASLVPLQVDALHHLYEDPAFARDDYRTLARLIAESAEEGDAILLNAPNQWEVFTYYYRGPLPIYPAPYRPGAEEAAGWVTDILSRHQGGRLFVLFWGDRESDPDQFVEGALAQQAYKAGDRWVTSVRLAWYGVDALPETPETVMGATLGDIVTLDGYSLTGATWQPGDVVPLTLFWTPRTLPPERYKVFVHLVDVRGELIGQTDMEPVTGFKPTTMWQAGETVVDRYGLALPDGLAPGTYALRVGMYRFSGERLTVTEGASGDFIHLREITVTAPQ